MNNTREHVRFHEWQIEALAILLSLTSAKHWCKTISACFTILSTDHLYIIIQGPHLPRKQQAGSSQELTAPQLTSGSSNLSNYQCSLGWYACGCTCRALSRMHKNSAITAIFTTINELVIMNVFFFLTMR